MNISENKEINNEFNIGFTGGFYENSKSGIGFELKIPQYYYAFNKHLLNILYISTYWNILLISKTEKHLIEEYMFGPFVSINYLNWYLPKDFSFQNYILNIGFRYSYREVDHIGYLPAFGIEAGYKLYDGIGRFYFNIQMSIVTFGVIGEKIHDYFFWKEIERSRNTKNTDEISKKPEI